MGAWHTLAILNAPGMKLPSSPSLLSAPSGKMKMLPPDVSIVFQALDPINHQLVEVFTDRTWV